MNATAVGVDLANSGFSIHDVDRLDKVVLFKRPGRTKLLPFLA